MKFINLLSITFGLAFALNAGLAVAQEKDVHKLEPRHGGVVVESNHIEYELVVKPETTELHVNDHGKMVDLSQARGKIVFVVAGQKIDRTLGGHGLVLKGDGIDLEGAGYTAVATVEFTNKKKAIVRFNQK